MKILHHYSALLRRKLFGPRFQFTVEFPHEDTFTRLAKLVRAQQIGNFTLGHYQSNTVAPPDHMTKSQCRFRSSAQGDFERVSWTINPISPEELGGWKPPAGGVREREHLLALSDAAGNIILCDYPTQAEAEEVMEAAAAAAQASKDTAAVGDLTCRQHAERVTTYPLTREEVRLLAAHWTKTYHDFASWCAAEESGGTSEEETRDYATDRVLLAKAVLGEDEIREIVRRSEVPLCQSCLEELIDTVNGAGHSDTEQDSCDESEPAHAMRSTL